MLLVAAHVLADVERWWTRTGVDLDDGPLLGDVYRLVHQVSVEAEAVWSLLDDRGNGHRIYTTLNALLPISLDIVERNADLIVWDFRIHSAES